jgi:dipeptidyl aminopeptidase/acylaminoacyl peptidase
MKRALTAVVLCLTLPATYDAVAESPDRTHQIVPEDYFSIANITGLAVSPDGGRVAYTEMRWEPPEDTRNTDLWVVDRSTGKTLRLTFGRATEGSPRWSPDGAFIYYSANRGSEDKPPNDGSKQVWRISPNGGEPQAVSRAADGIGIFDLAADGSAVYFTGDEEGVDEEWREMRERYPDLEYGHGVTTFSAVWKLDLVSWRVEKLVDATRVIHAMAVSPTGDRIAMVTTADDELIHKEGWSQVHVLDTGTGETASITPQSWRKTHRSPYGWLNNVTWSSDGQALAFSVDFDGYPTMIYVAEWNVGGPHISLIEKPPTVSAKGGVMAWRGTSRDLCFLGQEKARSRVYAIEGVRDGSAGNTTTLTPGDLTVDAFSFDRSGSALAVVTSTLTDPPDIYGVDHEGNLSRLTRVNPQVDAWQLPQIEIVNWTSEDGTPVEGILELPPGYSNADGPLPMVVEIHGGPTSSTRYQMRFWIYGRTLLAAKGFALLSPNYRGSIGYGENFLTELIGHENDRDVEDILSGVDAMVERGIADPDRLAVMGWSNGGYLSNALITATDRFKAASSGAGVLDQNIQWATQDTPGHNINFMNGTLPWQDPDAYRAASPLYGLGSVTTPTLIHVGGDDPRVPPAHSRALYRALQQYLGIATELVVYPGEPHSLTTYEHRKAKMEWDLAWFERYLGRGTLDDAD